MKKSFIILTTLLAVSSLAGCNESKSFSCPTSDCVVTPPTDSSTTTTEQKPDKVDVNISKRSISLSKAKTCDDYRNHLMDDLALRIAHARFEQWNYCGYTRWYDGVMEDDAVNTAVPDAEPPNQAGSDSKDDSAGEYTTTNVQEEGVDELDSVKNDGNYMYTIRGRQIHISKIWPVDDMKEVAVIERDELKNDEGTHTWLWPAGIFLTDDKKLIDISQIESWNYSSNYWYGKYSGVTSVRVFDVSNPESPKLIQTHQIDGSFTDARLIDNRLHLVTSANAAFDWYNVSQLSKEDIPGVPRFYNPCDSEGFDEESWSEEDWQEWEDLQDKWLAQGEQNTKEYLPVIRAWLDKKYPTIQDFDWPNHFDGTKAEPAISCQDLYIPAMASKESNGFLLVSEISGDNFENFQASAVADSGWLVYASKKNLYVSSFSYNWWWNNDDDDKNYTHIHHFDLGNNAGHVRYVNSGEVEGIASNSFYFSEYDNHLRVFSSPYDWSNSPEGHRLTVFDITSLNLMQQTGMIEGFGKDERIYSARMVGDKGYVVTYRNTDPLFVFDLSDPTHPAQVGELKINGYSSYIHPVGKDYLLTIGEDADDQGITNGMKLDFYDVSDPAHPNRKYTVKINDEEWSETGGSYGWSEALSNHHAFQYHEGSGLLAIPVNISKWDYTGIDYTWNYKEFSGMFVYRVTPDSPFEFLGGVNHSDLIDNKDNYYWWTSVDRSRFYFKNKGVYDKDAYIYTISRHGLKASNANKPDETFGMIKYNPESDDYWYYY